jgi:NAD(P)-dependent dehydrogenase (short-subunit alcohol dehydrogenase family)
LTPEVVRWLYGRSSNQQSTIRRYPFSVGELEDIARIALFLASDEARMTTGADWPMSETDSNPRATL